MKSCKFSVIIPCYNICDYIEATILSVLSQNYEDYEVIVINDGSTDNTFDVVSRFRENSKVKIFNKENGGVSSARNLGIEKSKGDYLLFLDGGDILKDGVFLEVEKYLLSAIDMVSFGFIRVNDSAIDYYSFKEYDGMIFTGESFLLKYFQMKIKQCMCSFVVRRDLIKNHAIVFDENTYGSEDQEFQIKCILNSSNVFYLSDIFFHYLVQGNSATTTFSEKHLTILDVYERLQEYIKNKSNNNELLRAFGNYALLEFFYVLKLSVKYGDKASIESVMCRDTFMKRFSVRFDVSIVFPIVFLLKFLYKINTSLLIRIYDKIG